MKPVFFPTQAAFRGWLHQHHASPNDELIVGYYKKATGKPSMTWNDSVDEGLCFGWKDGIRRKIDDETYCIRFTRSHWSGKNINRMKELIELGLAQPAGEEAFAARKESNSRRLSCEQKRVELSTEYEAKIKANPDAWKDWQKRQAGNKKTTAIGNTHR